MKNLKKIISKILKLKPSQIKDELSPKTVRNWDSFHALLLISELESHYNIQFTMEDILSVKNISDIKKSLKKYGIKLEEE